MSESPSHPPSPDQTETTYQLTGPHPGDEPYEITAVERDDWEPGQSCPGCDSTHLHETHLNEECAVHKDGASTFSAPLDRLGPVEYWCPECETLLYRHTAYALWLVLTNRTDHAQST